MSRRTRETHHVGLDGVPVVGGPEVLSESIEQVVCGWCADIDQVASITAIDEVR